ncbi:septum formation family protein [Kineococcus gypseus]|uniref:septum formation family protein n=1 Tax=Kineococcus gypseus TaxID=1637102 RepID=UPI003D7C8381
MGPADRTGTPVPHARRGGALGAAVTTLLGGSLVTAVLVAQGSADRPAGAPAAAAPGTGPPPQPPRPPQSPVPGPREVRIDDLAPGDCFDESADSLDTGAVLRADCALPHDAEVVAVHPVTGAAGDAHPGDEALQAEADARCGGAVASAVAAAGLADAGLRYSFYYPTPQDWAAGSRLVQCNLVSGTGLVGALAAGTLRAR